MIYALGTGTKPEFIFAELVRQGKSTKEANRIVNEALDEYERRQKSQRAYLENAVSDFQAESGAEFRRTDDQYYQPAPEPRKVVRKEPEAAPRPIYYDDDLDDDDLEDIEEPRSYIELEEDESEPYIVLDEDAEAEDFGIGFEKEMNAEDDKKDVKLPDGFSVKLPKNSGAKKKKSGKKEDVDLWEPE
jgi:hypothetical protein